LTNAFHRFHARHNWSFRRLRYMAATMRMLVAWSAASRSLGTATLCTERSEVVVGVRVVRVVVVPLLLLRRSCTV
jgi:hypothetical protein